MKVKMEKVKEVFTLEPKDKRVYILQVSREGDFLLLVEKNGLLTTQSGVQAKKNEQL